MHKLKRALFQNYRYVHLLLFALSMGIGGYSAIHLGQDVNYDLQNYHYSNPYIFMHQRVNYDIATSGVQSYENPLLDLPGYLAINHLKPRAAAGVLGMVQGINIWLIFEIGLILFSRLKCRRRMRYLIAMAIAVLSFFGGGNVSEIGNTMGDNLVSIFVLNALLLLLYAINHRALSKRNDKIMRCSAYFVMGMALGLKLTTAIFVVGLFAAGFAMRGTVKQKIIEQLFHGGAFLVGILATGGFWFIRMVQLFNNPVFPFYNGVFKSQYYPAVDFVDSRWVPRDLGNALSRPFDLMSRQAVSAEIAFIDPRLGILAGVFLGFLAIVLIKKLLNPKWLTLSWSRPTTAFWVFMLVSYFLWLSKFGYYRYALPIELLSLVAIATLIFSLIRNVLISTVLLAAVFTYITVQTVAIDWGRVGWQSTYFGIAKSDFTRLENATVLISGNAPVGFIVPYLPSTSQTIRVGSDLSSPRMGTPAMQALLQRAVMARRDSGTSFYAIIADEDKKASRKDFTEYGFGVGSCYVLPVYVRAGIPNKIRLCHLESL